ncbi:LLM class oxidoreductase [Thermoflavimicrobium dichotomicum]|uniref:Luciferase-type oxidoreductase, BA3436 family n=1 Tax=Thermoflavimicrobium dichotomicum TaxID=46223 RepID=A0A1I3LWD6_9BACL|nr:LLM class oxidoreductase [Thermoflavimicrobium dichotomicum]SFI89049.1 luciferase-type oxidoreductase, BA3436 family [Thermoflavimicrobium dichotomicum]
MDQFRQHPGYRRMFKENHMTLGLFFPIESYTGSIPRMDLEEQIKLAQRAEELNFTSLVVRDVPLHDPYFGDVGQIYDPWVFLGYLAANTEKIALLTGSIILTLRHPLHVAKAAASVDKISGGRLLLGVATGDRPIEFPSFSVDFEQRAELFREAMSVIKQVWKTEFPAINTARVNMSNGDLIPKPDLHDIPVLVTGHSGQSVEWIAKNADGWMYYPRNLTFQSELIRNWRSLINGFKPFSQSLYVDLTEDPDVDPTPIHLGFRTGRKFLIRFLESLKEIGVNHVMLNLKYGQRPASEVIEELGEEVLPLFPPLTVDE